MKYVIPGFFALVCLVGLSACQLSVDAGPAKVQASTNPANSSSSAVPAGPSPSAPPAVQAGAPVSAIQVIPERLVLEANKTAKASASVRYADNTLDGSVIWSSSDNTIASVDPASGEIQGLKAGEVTIVATASRDNQHRAGVQVSIKPAAIQTAFVTVEPKQVALKAKSTAVLTAHAAQGDGGRSPNLTWSSSDTSVAIVQGSGATANLTAVAPGTAVITVRADADDTRSDTVTVTVSE